MSGNCLAVEAKCDCGEVGRVAWLHGPPSGHSWGRSGGSVAKTDCAAGSGDVVHVIFVLRAVLAKGCESTPQGTPSTPTARGDNQKLSCTCLRVKASASGHIRTMSDHSAWNLR